MGDTWKQKLVDWGIVPDPNKYFVKVEKLPPLKGTYFFGGAGFNGAYIDDMIAALKEAGITSARAGDVKESVGRGIYSNKDAASLTDAFAVTQLNDNMEGKDGHGVYLTITPQEFNLGGPQFNLIGYSYGTLIAAHKALSYAELYKGVVDHVVIVGAPMQQDLLNHLKSSPNIKSVIVVNLQDHGDPIHAGMSNWDIVTSTPTLHDQQNNQTGHFWYAPMTPEGAQRRRQLAKYLYDQGLR